MLGHVVLPGCFQDGLFVSGGKNSTSCTLILTEGDSAKTLAVSGLGVVGRDRYGVFPLRGKILNVREASHKQVNNKKKKKFTWHCHVSFFLATKLMIFSS